MKENEPRFVQNVIRKIIPNHVNLIYKSRQGLSLNNLKCLIWHKNKPSDEEIFLTLEMRTYVKLNCLK